MRVQKIHLKNINFAKNAISKYEFLEKLINKK